MVAEHVDITEIALHRRAIAEGAGAGTGHERVDRTAAEFPDERRSGPEPDAAFGIEGRAGLHDLGNEFSEHPFGKRSRRLPTPRAHLCRLLGFRGWALFG